MVALFNEWEAYTPLGDAFCDEFESAIRPIIAKYAEQDVPYRSMLAAGVTSLDLLISEQRLKKTIQLRKNRRMNDSL